MGAIAYMKEAEEYWDGKSQLIWVNTPAEIVKRNAPKVFQPIKTHNLSLEENTREKYYTPRDIAERVEVTQGAVVSWINNGYLKATKVGGRWRLKEEDVVDFIERSTNGELHYG
jgi:excisionase family DNA binding protein